MKPLLDFFPYEPNSGDYELAERLEAAINPDASYSYIDVLTKMWNIIELAELVQRDTCAIDDPKFIDLIWGQFADDDALSAAVGYRRYCAGDRNYFMQRAALLWAYEMATPAIMRKLASHVIETQPDPEAPVDDRYGATPRQDHVALPALEENPTC